MWYNNILETIGNTPMIAFNKITKDIPGTILAKIDTFNPGNSIKDRMALQMIIDAEAEGKIKPGGTIIEGTSGNTGMGLALVCIARGYKLICTMSDKQSKEKVDILRAVGAEVIVCPTDVEPEDPRSYYSVARRLETEIPNSYYVNQYDNLSNTKAHYLTTGPEIWEQTSGQITHLVACSGTGGTISGTARFLKEKNPNIKILGVDAFGSVLKKYHETKEFDTNEIYPYRIEGLGKNLIPTATDFEIIDEFVKVSDEDSAHTARELAKTEGLFVGYTSGAAFQAVKQFAELGAFDENSNVVIIFPDHGSRYMSKIYSDDWMNEQGFFDSINSEEVQKIEII